MVGRSLPSTENKAGAAEALYNEMVALQARKSTQKLPQHLRDKLAAAVTYYKNHRHQMDYINYTEQHFPIGSGVTEAACKTLIKQRFVLPVCAGNNPVLLAS